MLFSTALRLGDIKYLILMLELCTVTLIVKGRVLLEIPSMHILVQYFQSLYRNEDIYELKGIHITNFEVDLFSSSVEYCSLLYTYRDLRGKNNRDKNSLFALEESADWSYDFFH